MSSILTNNSAMVALQTLKGVNANLAKTTDEISTGKKVASAKDNAAVWAISKVMESDVKGFQAISESLSLGQATVAVARNASETISGLLTTIKGKVVAAQESNVDRGKLQTDIAALRDQITSVVNGAQFNGLNLVKGTEDVDVLASLDRNSDGTVSASHIVAKRNDLTTTAGTYGAGASLNANATASAASVTNTGNTATITMGADADYSNNTFSVSVGGVTVNFTGADFAANDDEVAAATKIAAKINGLNIEGVTVTDSAGDLEFTSTRAFEDVALSTSGAPAGTTASATVDQRAEKVTFSASAAVQDGDGYRVSLGGSTYDYVARTGDSMEDVAKGLKAAIDGGAGEDITTKVVKNATSGAWELKIDNDSTTSAALTVVGNKDGTATGGLRGLEAIDVTTKVGAERALSNIETYIGKSIDAAASFGSVQGRIDNQSSFVSKLMDSLKSGIGSMVDADMEEKSAQLQALQVQQQLATQSLSIANQAPQSIMALFR